jgi:hypothetical protein
MISNKIWFRRENGVNQMKSREYFLAFLGAVLLSGSAGAVATDPSSAPITLGRWHSDLYKAEAYSQQHDIPMVFIWGSIGCSYCNKMDGYVETQTFKDWMAERQLVMVYIKDYANQSPPEMHYGHDGLNGQIWDFPFVSVYWQSKNAQVYNFVGRYYSSDQDVCAQLLIDQIEDYIAEYSSEPPEGVTIEGPETVLDNSSGEQFTAIYSDAEGNQQDVTSAAQWSVNDPAAASISTSGFFTPADIADGVESDVIVSAVYNPGSGAFTGERLVTVSDSSVPIGTVQGVVIDGPGWLQSGASAGYAAMFIYANGATFAVDAGNSIVWSVTDGPVSIAADGTVTVQSVSSDTSATLNLRVTTPTRKTYYGTLQIAIVTQPPQPEYTLVISGPDAVNEGANAAYTATLTAEGQDDQDVTAQAQWSVSGAAGTVVTAGELTAGQVETDTPCTITAVHDDQNASKTVQILHLPIQKNVIALEVRGSAAIYENSSASYTCIAYFSDESWQDVTAQSQWGVDPGAVASMQGARLDAQTVDQDTTAIISANYSGVSGDRSVTIRDTGDNDPVQPVALEVSGPPSIRGGTITNFICELVYSDNTRSNITANAQWLSNRMRLARFRKQGLLNTGVVEQDTAVEIIVRYITAGGVLLSTNAQLTLTRDAVDPNPPQRSILISGDATVQEGQFAQYQAVLIEDDEPVGDITDQVVWSSDNTAVATIDPVSGLLSALQVWDTVTVEVRADYSFEGSDYSDTFTVQINPITRNLQVMGAAELNAGSSEQYQAVLSEEGAADLNVTQEALWSVDNDQAASIDQNGMLTAVQVESEQQVNVTAIYQVGIKGYTGSVAVTISPVLEPEGDPTGIIIQGPDAVESGSTGQYGSYYTYANGATAPVDLPHAYWTVSGNNVTISSSGLLTVAQVSQPAEVTVILNYNRTRITKTVLISVSGKFALAGLGNPPQPVVDGGIVRLREGEQCTVAVERYQGDYGAADAYFDLTPPESGIVLQPLSWADGEEGVKFSTATAPVLSGVQLPYRVEVLLTSPDIAVNATADCFELEIIDAEYGSSVADYLSVFGSIPFTTSNDEWFYPRAALDGGENMLRSMCPDSIGQSCVLQSSMTGPGVLTFYAGISSADMNGPGAGTFHVMVDQTLYTVDATGNVDEPKAVVVPEGTHSVSFIFERSVATVAGDFAWIIDPEYVPLDKAELLAPADGATVLLGEKEFVWSNVLCGLCAVPGVTAGYQLYAGSGVDNMQLLDTIVEFESAATVSYPVLFETTGNISWRVDTFVQVEDEIFNFSSDPATFSLLDATAPQFIVSEENLQGYSWFEKMALDGSSIDISLIQDFDVNIGSLGYTADSAAEEIVVNVISGSLPTGITPVVDTESGLIFLSGTPSQIESGTAVLRIAMLADGVEIPGTTLILNYEVKPLPAKLVGQYKGFVWYDAEYNCTPDGFCSSATLPTPAVVTVTAQGAVSVSFQLPGKSYSQSMGNFDADTYYRLGIFEKSYRDDIDADTSIDYTVSINWNCEQAEGYNGTPVADISMEHWYMEYDPYMQDYFPAATMTSGYAYPDIWSSGNGGYDLYDQQVLDQLQGYYTVSLEDNDFSSQNYDSFGNGYLTLTINDQGAIAIDGKMADGESINTTTKLYVASQCEDTLAFTELRALPSAYDGGVVYMQLHFKELNGTIVVEVRESTWVNMDPQANGYYNEGFKRIFNGVCGGKYDNTKNLFELYQDVAGFVARYPVFEDNLTVVDFAADGNSFVIDSQAGTSLSVNLDTGVISVTANGHSGQGVLTPYFKNVNGLESVAARAYTLRTSQNFVIYPEDPVYQYTRSSAWQLEIN